MRLPNPAARRVHHAGRERTRLPRICRSSGNQLRLRLRLLLRLRLRLLAVLLVVPLPSRMLLMPRLMLARVRLPVVELLRLIPCPLLLRLPPRLQKQALVRRGRLRVWKTKETGCF